MVRRRSSKGRDTKSKPKPVRRSDATIKKWNTREDIPMDEEDQFHASKDKILLDSETGAVYSDDGDDDEVFALKGMPNDSASEDDDDVDQYGEDYDDELLEQEEVIPTTKKEKKKAKKAKKAKEKTIESSDEEDKSEEEEDESWGQGRAAYYSSNAKEIDSDDEEANELEEQEARRLQTKLRQELQDEDFGLSDDFEFEGQPESDDVLAPTPSIIPSLPTDKNALLRHLEKTSPESLALARDWDDTAHKLQKTRLRIEKLEAEKSDDISLGMIHLHYQALLSYSTVLAFYLHMRSSPKYAHRLSLLQTHPIMQRLLTLKQSLQTLEDLDFAVSDEEDDEGDEEDYLGMDMNMDDILADGESVWRFDEEGGLEPNELDDLLNDADLPAEPLEITTGKPPKKKRKVAKEDKKGKSKAKPITAEFDLVEPEFVSSKSSNWKHSSTQDTSDAFGDAITLTAADVADKSARKKSLQFHTSKIESASARRQGARNQAIGGDDDIPYRERKKVKEARLVKEASKRARAEGGGADLDDEEPEPRVGEKRSWAEEDEDEDGESPDDYYELVKKRSKEEKDKKKAEYEEVHGRSRVPLEDETSGQRSITRAILKNRGLTPHRPKSVRNPRVKKRQKFEKAKKKVSSQKAIFKGGLSETKGRYDGEKSGISKVVKSVRLG